VGVLKGNTSFKWRFSWEENINFVHVTFVTSNKNVDFTKARKHRVRQIFRGMTGCAVYHPSDQVPPSRWQINHLYQSQVNLPKYLHPHPYVNMVISKYIQYLLDGAVKSRSTLLKPNNYLAPVAYNHHLRWVLSTFRPPRAAKAKASCILLCCSSHSFCLFKRACNEDLGVATRLGGCYSKAK